MDDIVSPTVELTFKVHEIICLENHNSRLYGEVIQLLPHRSLCWFRPMCLVMSEFDSTLEQTQLIDLQSGSDLLWPVTLFRSVLDTEVISFLSQLKDNDRLCANKSSRQCLNKFVQQVWQENRDKF